MRQFVYLNDTDKDVTIHPVTRPNVECNMDIIKPMEERIFILPKNTTPWVKLWQHTDSFGVKGLRILVSARESHKDN